jgi:hypothetical protein
MHWISEARASEKRDVVKLAQLAAKGGNESTHPPSWLPAHQDPVFVNDRGRVRLAKTIPVTADRIQSDMLKNRHGSDAKDTHLEKKRQWFKEWAPIPSINSVGDFFHLKANPVYTESIAQVLSESAKRGLARWQVDGPEQNDSTAANAMRSLRSIADAVARIPRYREHARDQMAGATGRSDLLHEYSTMAPRGSRSLMSQPYAIPDRQVHVSKSNPNLPRPFTEQAEIDKISRPGGYVVNLHDREPLQMLKNRERNQSSKIAKGGAAQWNPSSSVIGMHSTN